MPLSGLFVVALLAASCSSGSDTSSPDTTAPPPQRPNIVFILTDDLSSNLINERFAPHIVDLEREG
jgi:N-acetylglucosamine-6-sulfatase